jgi:hypothetical protein
MAEMSCMIEEKGFFFIVRFFDELKIKVHLNIGAVGIETVISFIFYRLWPFIFRPFGIIQNTDRGLPEETGLTPASSGRCDWWYSYLGKSILCSFW